MDEIILVLIQLLVEFFFDVFLGATPELLSWNVAHNRPLGLYLFWILCGAILGLASFYFYPGYLIHSSGLRIANCILSPVLAGTVAVLIRKLRPSSNPDSTAYTFWVSYLFCIAYLLTRLGLGLVAAAPH